MFLTEVYPVEEESIDGYTFRGYAVVINGIRVSATNKQPAREDVKVLEEDMQNSLRKPTTEQREK